MQVSQLECEVEARKSEGKSLLEDNIRWKGRAQQILEKYERIDPVEHESLKSSVGSLVIQKTELESSLTTLQRDFTVRIQEKEARIQELEIELSSLQDAHQNELIEKENEIDGLRNPDNNVELVC